MIYISSLQIVGLRTHTVCLQILVKCEVWSSYFSEIGEASIVSFLMDKKVIRRVVK